MLAYFCRILFVCLFPLFWTGLFAQPDPLDDRIEIELIYDSSTLEEKKEIWVGVEVRLAPNWHIYWKNSGESGYPTTIHWNLPNGWSAEPLQFPAPYLYQYEGMTGYALKNRITLLTCLKAPPSLASPFTIDGTLEALVCNESTCLPYEKNFTLSLSPKGQPIQEPEMLSLVARARSALPVDEKSVTGSVLLDGVGGQISLLSPVFESIPADKFHFFPEDSSVQINHSKNLSLGDSGDLLIDFKFTDNGLNPPSRIEGVLIHPEIPRAWSISLPLAVDEISAPSLNRSTVVGDSASEYFLLYILLSFVFFAMAAWGFGKAIQPGASSRIWYLFTCLSLIAGGWIAYPHSSDSSSSDSLNWMDWSPDLQDKLLAEGRAVYIDYTAKWCLSCQVNKRVYAQDEVIDSIIDKKVSLLRADWTQKSPEILQSLQSHGREGVPFNVFYPASKNEEVSIPVYLPEILTSEKLVQTVQSGQSFSPPAEAVSGLLTLLGFGWLGGLMLNVMPCVFPVIGLKIMGFVKQSGTDHRLISRHGQVFTLGVLLSFWMIVGVLILMRQGLEQEFGWGFQLQEPLFVLVLAVFLFLFGLSLSGVFDMGISVTGIGSGLSQKSGLVGSFFSGVLATVVATPCMAPFLGVAIGAALTMSPLASFSVFTCIAIGLSTPYLLLSYFPKWLEKLPKPGAWMETFKQFMAFPIYATVAWLIWTLCSLIQ